MKETLLILVIISSIVLCVLYYVNKKAKEINIQREKEIKIIQQKADIVCNKHNKAFTINEKHCGFGCWETVVFCNDGTIIRF